MGWRGNIPEFSCAASKSENFPIDKLYRHFYSDGQEEIWRNQEGNRKKRNRKQAWQGLDERLMDMRAAFLPSNPCQACFLGAAPIIIRHSDIP
jgi:hypothetical protein